MSRYRQLKLIFKISIICILSSIILPGGYILFTPKISKVAKLDCAVVLGAAAWEKKPSPVFKERIRHAIELYKRDRVKKIFFTGGLGSANSYSESSVAKKYALEAGVSENDMFIEEFSQTTFENLKFIKPVLNENVKNGNFCFLVSDPLHLPRALLMAENLELNMVASATPTSMFRSKRSKLNFLIREIRLMNSWFFKKIWF